MSSKKQPSDADEAFDVQAEPRGESGPLERERAFAATRFATVRPRGAPPPPPLAPLTPGQPPSEQEVGLLPPSFRQKLITEYRKRQQDALPPAAPGGPGAAPLAPLPPPANNWIPIGPSVVRQGQAANRPAVSGRVAGLAVASGGARVYAASANGGVWRSDDSGQTWHSTMEAWDLDPTTSSSDSLACGAIAIHPANPDRIYVGTGEAIGSLDAYFGVGPIRSDDGGDNWFTEPVAPGSPTLAGTGFYRLAVDPGDPERVTGATPRGLYRREPNGSGGFHWARKVTGVFTSVVAARTGSTTTFYAARQGGGVFSSTDGHNWIAVGTGFPTANVGRIGLAVQSINPNVVYALIAKPSSGLNHMLGVWRLDTGTNTWRQVGGAPGDLFGSDPTRNGQGWYDLAIAVDPNNVNRVYLGGSTKWVGGQWSGSLYRSAVSSSGSGAGLTYSMTNTHIGANVHPDIHGLEFTPGDSSKLWVGCDGGVFYTADAVGSASFEARNVGLNTLTMQYLATHPAEDAVLFCGTQDNGTTRYTGEEAWLHSASGDGGFVVINWNDPYRVLRTYVTGNMETATDGGQGYGSWTDASLPSADLNNAEWYAPLIGTPPNPAAPADANIVAFGGRRPWISTTFGGGWQSIPSNNNSDDLPANILSLVFASAMRLYAGTTGGEVYRFVKSGATWTRTRIDAAPLLAGLPVTDIAVDPADSTGNSIYITFGGSGDYRHVWRFDGTNWQQRSGPAAGSANSLLNVQHNAIVVDPNHTNHLYIGADIGVWRSTDSGATWSVFSNGLPDAAVLDLKLHNGRRLLWAATHGRGVYERTLDTEKALGVELYVRDTQLDRGRHPTVDGLNDPIQPGQQVWHYRGPDIKVDVPSATGTYQTPTDQINFFQFVDKIVDGSGGVAAVDPALGVAHNRVYVQVHNRGVTPANNVQVMVLLANASAGLPNLPAGYEANVQAGTAISTPHWQTVGFQTLNDLRVGFPQVAAFDLPSTLLPPPASLAGNAHFCLLALLHSPDDPFGNTQTHVDTLSPNERKAAHKNLHVVQFTGTLPPAAPEWMALRLHGIPERELLSDLVLDLVGYRGRVRLLIPGDLKLVNGLEGSLDGFHLEDPIDFGEWSDNKLGQLQHYLDRELFDPLWCKQMIEAIHQVHGQPMLVADTNKEPALLRRFVVPPDAFYTVFIAIDRPEDARIGDSFNFNVYQRDVEKETVLGGSTYQVQIVPEPDVEKKVFIEVLGKRWRLSGQETVYVRVTDEAGTVLTPDDDLRVELFAYSQLGVEGEPLTMGYHRAWRAFWLGVDRLPHLSTGVVKVTAKATVRETESRKTKVVQF